MAENDPTTTLLWSMHKRINVLEEELSALRCLVMAGIEISAEGNVEDAEAIIARAQQMISKIESHGDWRRQVGADKTRIALERILAALRKDGPPLP